MTISSARNIGKMTLLDLTQNILEKMDSDEVNSIFDTVESRAVAGEVRDAFRHITSNSEDYQKEGFVQLEPLVDPLHFNQLKLPDTVMRVEEFWMLNNCSDRICLEWVEPGEFVQELFKCKDHCSQMAAAAGTKGPLFPVGTQCDAERYTSFDGVHIFLESVNLQTRTALIASDTGARCVIAPEFRFEDDFVPPLHADEFPILLNEAMDASFIHYKGVSNAKAQARVREQKVRKQNNRERIGTHTDLLPYPPFGRFARGEKVS